MTTPYANAGKRNYASYYSGTDIRIYFGDQWVDEIVEIEWSLQEQVAPIYGFASYTWDKVARGNRIVQGSFVINFKEAGYLQTILNSLSSDMTNKSEWFSLTDFTQGQDPSLEIENGYAHRSGSVEEVLKNFDTLAQGYENAIWGYDVNSVTSTVQEGRKKDTFFYTLDKNPENKALRDHGFNILLTYGNTGAGDASGSGAIETSRGKASKNTAQSIVGVQLTGLSQRVDPSGNPVSEVYSFIAKDVSGNVMQAF